MSKTLLFIATIATITVVGIAGCKIKDPLACDSQTDCAPESYCYSHVCIISQCTNDSDCPGRKCVNSQCVENGSPSDENHDGVSLTVTKTGSGTITSIPPGINCGTACIATYSFGSSVSLTAEPAANHVFSGWGESCSGMGSCNLTMNTPQTVSAGFACIPETDDELCESTCGSEITDRCGNPRTCGCPYPQVCGGGSVTNKCACANEIHPPATLANWLPIPLSPLANAYQELGNGVVLDTQTCLRWKKDYQKEGETIKFTLGKAKSICKNLGDGWRLPTTAELVSLVDYQKDSPTINPLFDMPTKYYFFSSSTGEHGVYFGNGCVLPNEADIAAVRCVR